MENRGNQIGEMKLGNGFMGLLVLFFLLLCVLEIQNGSLFYKKGSQMSKC